MFRKVLVALDLSTISDKVFSEALDLARREGASLILLHVLSGAEDFCTPGVAPPISAAQYPLAGDAYTEYFRREWMRYSEQGAHMLRGYCQMARAAGLSVETVQLPGSAGSLICEQARSRQVDLIFIGRRGRSGLGEMFLGSVSNYVLHHAPCSVLVLQNTGTVAPKPAERKPETASTAD